MEEKQGGGAWILRIPPPFPFTTFFFLSISSPLVIVLIGTDIAPASLPHQVWEYIYTLYYRAMMMMMLTYHIVLLTNI